MSALNLGHRHGREHPNARPNAFEVRGDHAAIVLRRSDGRTEEGLIDLCDLPRVQAHPLSWHAWTMGRTTYVRSRTPRPNPIGLYLHRVLVGDTPPGYVVDHRDWNGLNNRRSNLRLLPHARNLLHRSYALSKHGFRGITWHRRMRRWQGHVKIDGRMVHIGTFTDPVEAERAVKARIEAEIAASEIPISWESQAG